jgi:hypothetical protein
MVVVCFTLSEWGYTPFWDKTTWWTRRKHQVSYEIDTHGEYGEMSCVYLEEFNPRCVLHLFSDSQDLARSYKTTIIFTICDLYKSWIVHHATQLLGTNSLRAGRRVWLDLARGGGCCCPQFGTPLEVQRTNLAQQRICPRTCRSMCIMRHFSSDIEALLQKG